MSYLMIRNPGVADYRGLTLLGVSTTRNAGQAGTIGTFGSGCKLSIALLLRNGIEPVIACGNLKMNFLTKTENIKTQEFHRVCVKYQGTDIDNSTKNSTEDLGFVLEWGVADWTSVHMAFREFVSNAIDGSIAAGASYKAVEFEVVEKPRAKAGFTSVFLPFTPEIEEAYKNIGEMFLHFGDASLLNTKILPKRHPERSNVLIYKNGVLVATSPFKSVFDYNLGYELTLDESRNASEWDVRYAVAKVIRDASPEDLAKLLGSLIADKDLWEGKLDSSYVSTFHMPADKTRRAAAFSVAWKAVAGKNGVVTSGVQHLASFVQEKGFTPVSIMLPNWVEILESYDIPSETTVLSKSEAEGKIVCPATQEMFDCTKKVWSVFESFNLTNGKQMPGVKGFTSIMNGGGQTFGYYIPGGNDIYLHTSLGGKLMFKVALEECCHYLTQSSDGSRDVQDWCFNVITEMCV